RAGGLESGLAPRSAGRRRGRLRRGRGRRVARGPAALSRLRRGRGRRIARGPAALSRCGGRARGVAAARRAGGVAARLLLRLHALLPALGGVVGDVPAAALQDERGRGQEPVNRATTAITGGQRRLRDALADLEGAVAPVTTVVVGGHYALLQQKGRADAPCRQRLIRRRCIGEYSTRSGRLPGGRPRGAFRLRLPTPPATISLCSRAFCRSAVHGFP